MLTSHDIAKMILAAEPVKIDNLSKTSSYLQTPGGNKFQVAPDLRVYLSVYPVTSMTEDWLAKYSK